MLYMKRSEEDRKWTRFASHPGAFSTSCLNPLEKSTHPRCCVVAREAKEKSKHEVMERKEASTYLYTKKVTIKELERNKKTME